MDRAVDEARRGHLSYFENLEKKDLDPLIGKKDEDGRTLLHTAVSGGNSELVQFLANEGAIDYVNSQDDEGWAPLHSAASCGFERVVDLLISWGANVHMKNNGGRTPLHYAASKGHQGIVRLLLKHGANGNVADLTGSTPLHRGASTGKLSTVRVLINEGNVVIDPKDGAGATPLYVAVSCQHDSVAVFLVGKGANLAEETKEGETPLHIAGKLLASLQAAAVGDIDVDDM